ncbi:MAG: hypothetical protein AAF716_11975 [Cyanobacteria bacterium P01_D01_bin.1]
MASCPQPPYLCAQSWGLAGDGLLVAAIVSGLNFSGRVWLLAIFAYSATRPMKQKSLAP